MLVEGLNSIAGISCEIPEGGFWVFPNVSKIDKNTDRLANYLLKHHGVGVTPGSIFGINGLGHVRIWYLHEEEYILKGFEKLKKGLNEYRKVNTQ